MKRIMLGSLVIAAMALGMSSLQLQAGLYDDDAKAIKSGDVIDLDYWWCKYDADMLEKAVKTRQPEGLIGLQLVSYEHRLDDLIKKYPNHEDLKKWKARADEINKKIDPNAERRMVNWSKGFLWADDTYAQPHVNIPRGKFAEEHNDLDTAFNCYQLAASKLDFLVTHEDILDSYSDEDKAWVKEQKPLIDKKRDDLARKTHHM